MTKYQRLFLAAGLALAFGFASLMLAKEMGNMFKLPGKSSTASPHPLSTEEESIRSAMHDHVYYLAGTLGARSWQRPNNLVKAAHYIEDHWKKLGFSVQSQEYQIDGIANQTFRNLEIEIKGSSKPDEIIVVGAHYDSVLTCPGANDNASGVAAILEMAHVMKESAPAKTIRFVAFVNEEPPFFSSTKMGSAVYANRAKESGENIIAMLSVETIGYYSDEPNSQRFPQLMQMTEPNKGNFICFVSNEQSRDLNIRCLETFRKTTEFPAEGIAAPEQAEAIDFSDQMYFWKNGYRGLMITDTAMFRYPHYHEPTDTPDKVNYERAARVTLGLTKVVADLASAQK
jgi:hypothetical protein